MKKLLFVVLAVGLSFFVISCRTVSVYVESMKSLSTIYKSNDFIQETSQKVSRAMEDITPEEEYYIGRAVAASVLTNYSVYEDSAKEKYCNLICRAITINSENPYCYNGYHVKLLDTDEINAYATSSGIIFITRGLYDAVTTEDELAAVIAHELGHIMLRHSTKAIKSSRWTEVGTSFTTPLQKDILLNEEKLLSLYSEMSNELDDMVQDITSELVIKGYSKMQEFDADQKAVQLLADAGYSPESMISMLEVLLRYSRRSSAGMFSTHPHPSDRIDAVRGVIYASKLPRDTRKYRQDRFVAAN